jgi:hypothetical protein
MRIDLEQFLAVTMMLGTAGAIGFVVISRDDGDPPANVEDAVDVDEPDTDVTASPSPVPTPAAAPIVEPVPEGPPPLPEEPDADFLMDPELDGMPAPHVEGF